MESSNKERGTDMKKVEKKTLVVKTNEGSRVKTHKADIIARVNLVIQDLLDEFSKGDFFADWEEALGEFGSSIIFCNKVVCIKLRINYGIEETQIYFCCEQKDDPQEDRLCENYAHELRNYLKKYFGNCEDMEEDVDFSSEQHYSRFSDKWSVYTYKKYLIDKTINKLEYLERNVLATENEYKKAKETGDNKKIRETQRLWAESVKKYNDSVEILYELIGHKKKELPNVD